MKMLRYLFGLTAAMPVTRTVVGPIRMVAPTVALCLLFPVADAGAQPQPPQYFAGTGHWYQAVSPQSALTWVLARDSAQVLGGYLVSILSQAENDFVFSILSPAADESYIGAYELAGEGDWQWASGEPWGYTNWNLGTSEPNNSGGKEDAGAMEVSWPGFVPGAWNDLDRAVPNMAVWFVVEYNTTPGSCAGNALQFDGTNDEALIPDDASLSFGAADPMSVELWFKWSGTGGTFHLLGKRPACGDMNYQLAGTASSLSFGSNGIGANVAANIPVAADQWMHVAGTSDGSNIRIYVNGVFLNSQAGSLALTNTAPLKIGGSGSCTMFPGEIDEVRIWSIARSGPEIAADYNKSVNPATAGLVGYWRFDETTGSQTVLDLSPFVNNGTLGSTGSVQSSDPTRVASTAPIGSCGPTAPTSLRWPLAGSPADRVVALGFGANWPAGDCPPGTPKLHTGIDVSASIGEEVDAAEAGTVRAVVDGTASGFAYAVTIEHSGYTTVCWHVTTSVVPGQIVAKGQPIGAVADMGANSHLHFGVRLATYTNISNRGALPVSPCGGDPAFPDGFTDPAQLVYELNGPPPAYSFSLPFRDIPSDGITWTRTQPFERGGDGNCINTDPGETPSGHLGEDWAYGTSSLDMPVFSIGRGKVVGIGDGGPTWNGIVKVLHNSPTAQQFPLPDGGLAESVMSVYAHLDKTRLNEWVSIGEIIERGQQIGVVGPPPVTSTGAHLHWEIRTDISSIENYGYSCIPSILADYAAPSAFVNALQFSAYSPVSLVVFSPDGDSIGPGFDSFGLRAFYEDTVDQNGDGDPDDRVTIGFASPGQYIVRVLPDTGADPGDIYSLGVAVWGGPEEFLVTGQPVPPPGQADEMVFGFSPCDCACNADPQCDGVRSDVLDVVAAVGVAFRSTAPITDGSCPRERTDVNCDGVTDVLDVVAVVDVAFRSADAAVKFCNPCA